MTEESYSLDPGIPTFVALPLETLENKSSEKHEQFHVIKNAIIKTLSDGSLCIIDVNNLNLSEELQQPSVQDVPPSLHQNEEILEEKAPAPTFKCFKCKEEFDKIALYRKHMMWHRNVKKFKCDKCSAGYNVETNLKIHMAMHAEGKPTCPLCMISFQRLASLKSHLMLHQVEEVYTCDDCTAEFEKEEELNKHLQNHHNNNSPQENNLICSYCKVQFEDPKKYREHISHHIKVKKMVLSGKKSRRTNTNREYPHICNVCLKSFSRLSLLERHLRVHSGERPFICPHCNRGFNQKGTLQIHMSKHTGIKPFQCTLCSAKFNQKGNLRVHVEKTHTAPMPGVKTYKCSHCTCIFKKIASLNVHITKSHSNSGIGEEPIVNQLEELEKQSTAITPDMKPVEQEIIEQNKKILNEIKQNEGLGGNTANFVRLAESFLDGSVRRYLVMQKKINDVRWYICNYCKKEFKKPSDLIRHTRVHTKEKPFMCKQCGAYFSLKSTLFCHIKTHIGNNSYTCLICKKKLSSLRSLNLHVRKHSEKSNQIYKCTKCNKSFPSMNKAKLHSREVHNNIETDIIQIAMKQPLIQTNKGLIPVSTAQSEPSSMMNKFHCQICNTKFTKLTNLNRHMLLHNNERKFKCEQCGKAYTSAYALKEHLLYHSGVKNHCCKVCGKRFVTNSLLKRHLITHNSHKPYVCPYCNKNFKSLLLCKKHMNVHKKEINVGFAEDNNKGELLNNYDIAMNAETGQELLSSFNNELFQVDPNSIQIVSNNNETILINSQDLPLGENLYEGKNEGLLFNSLNELQDVNIFSIDELNQQKCENNIVLNDYPQTELNLLFNLDPAEFETNLNDIHLGEVPAIVEDNIQKNDVDDNNKNKFICEECNKVFKNERMYKKHVNHHKNAKKNGAVSRQCTFCDKSFKKQSDLIRHIRTHTGEKPFACDKCDKKFSLKSTLISHQRTHNPVIHKQHQCIICNSFFTSKSSLKVHMSVHTGDKSYSCNFCPLKFRTAHHRKTHETNNHLNPATKNPTIPEVQEISLQNELENVLVVQEQLQFPIDQLNILNDSDANQLEPLILQQLQTNLTLPDSLIPTSLIQLDDGTLLNIKTINEENGEKPRNFECDICHKKYTSKDVLRRHRKIHGVNRNYPCGKCDKGFDTQQELQIHEKTHDGYRPYSCIYCTNSFAKKRSLVTHIKRIHSNFSQDL